MSPSVDTKYVSGFIAGFKRMNVTKARSDLKDKGRKYSLGYILGIVLKIVIVIASVYFGAPIAL